MANFIQDLQAKNKAHETHLREVEQEINEFLMHLQSPKFQGVDSQGDRKDWISTNDVSLRMQEIRSLILSGLSI